MTSPIFSSALRSIGIVESVASDEIRVLLDVDAPSSMALNTGVPTSFPRINSYVLIPNESGAIVGIVIWIGVERSAYPKRQGLKDFGLVDLPFPLRKMTISPIGTLKMTNEQWILERGVRSFPSVGDSVILPETKQVMAIVTGSGPDQRVEIGTCPTAHDAKISIDPDKLFGRHLAVLGNTGSGKSCTVAAIIRSSIEAAQETIQNVTEVETSKKPPNARFIVLDPNGEYSKCFDDLGSGSRVFRVAFKKDEDEGVEFKLPGWMWNSSEWAAVAQASPKAQKPLLQSALRDLRSQKCEALDIDARIWMRCRVESLFLSKYVGKGTIGWPDTDNCGSQLLSFLEDITSYGKELEKDDPKYPALKDLYAEVNSVHTSNLKTKGKYLDFSDTSLEGIRNKIDAIITVFGDKIPDICVNEDLPIEFPIENLADYLEVLAAQEGSTASQFIATLVTRIKTIVADTRMSRVINPETSITLVEWLEGTIGKNDPQSGQVAVIDLSLVPHEILHLIIAVASRLVLESLQRYRQVTKNILPTVIILEEAHTFVSRRLHNEEITTPADMCRSIFERIAREGRKHGLGLVLSSQRPSELSETVLSQCGSFFLHRITNDRDQDLVSRLVPDTARGLLKELPSLPTRTCVLLGIASRIPVLLEVEDLKEAQRPKSDDPDFWDVWIRKAERNVDWSAIVKDWASVAGTDAPTVTATSDESQEKEGTIGETPA